MKTTKTVQEPAKSKWLKKLLIIAGVLLGLFVIGVIFGMPLLTTATTDPNVMAGMLSQVKKVTTASLYMQAGIIGVLWAFWEPLVVSRAKSPVRAKALRHYRTPICVIGVLLVLVLAV